MTTSSRKGPWNPFLWMWPQVSSEGHTQRWLYRVLFLCKELGCIVNLEKIRGHPTTGFYGHSLHPDILHCSSYPRELDQSHLRCIHPSSHLAVSHRDPSRPILSGSFQLPPHPSSSVKSLLDFEPVPGPSEYRGPCARGLKASSQVVAGPGSLCRYSGDVHQLFPWPFHRRMSNGMGSISRGRHASGIWEPQEQHLHINLLEMRAVTKALLGFSFPQGTTILVSSDNSTIISYINREGRHAPFPSGRRPKSFSRWSSICRSPFRRSTFWER